jgi:hypothetical protein
MSIEDNLHPCNMMIGEFEKSPVLATAGSYVLVSAGTGKTVTEAIEGTPVEKGSLQKEGGLRKETLGKLGEAAEAEGKNVQLASDEHAAAKDAHEAGRDELRGHYDAAKEKALLAAVDNYQTHVVPIIAPIAAPSATWTRM